MYRLTSLELSITASTVSTYLTRSFDKNRSSRRENRGDRCRFYFDSSSEHEITLKIMI